MILLAVVAFATTDLPQLMARFFTNDFHIADFYYSLREEEEPFEEEIVLVNVGSRGRPDIAKQLFKLAQFQPKVIALDIIFKGDRDPKGDEMLEYVLANVPNIVLISESHEKQAGEGDSLVLSNPRFAQHAYHGIGENIMDANIGRRMQKKYRFANGDSALHFAVQTTMLYDSAKAQAFLNRPNKQENIYFLGNIPSYVENASPTKFFVLDYKDVIDENFTADLIRDKIVLMGYLGEFAGDDMVIEDKFYSPLKSFEPVNLPPDMFGAVFHANTMSMILRERYIDALSHSGEVWLALGIGMFNCLIFLALLRYSATRRWYAVISSLIIIGEFLAYPQLALYLFDEKRYLLDLSFTPLAVALSSYASKVYVHRLLCWASPRWKAQTRD